MINKYIDDLAACLQAINNDRDFDSQVEACISLIVSQAKKGGKLLIAGNGGSAADAQHFAAELMGRFKFNRPAIKALSLSVDTSFITAWSNDFDYNDIFSRQLAGLADQHDVFMAISTSGNSLNLMNAVTASKKRGIPVIALLGKDGGTLAPIVDLPIIVPNSSTPRIQEVHALLIHIIAEEVEKRLYGNEQGVSSN